MTYSDKQRVVIHSQVLLEGVLSTRESSCEILNLVLDRDIYPVADRYLLSLYRENLLSPHLNLKPLFVKDFLKKFSSLCELVSPTPLSQKHREYLGDQYVYYSISISAGKIPLISPRLHYFLGDPEIHIPVFTPEGYIKDQGY